MTWNRRAYAGLDCEGPLGFPMTEVTAREVELLLKQQPAGDQWQYQRVFAKQATSECLDDQRADVSVITSGAVDRDREVVLPGGVVLDGFRKNPVVTFNHRYDLLPVGRALWIKRDGDAIKAKTRYAPRPPDWQGDWLPDAIWHMVKIGDLKGKSIGFLPLEGRPPSAEEIELRPGWADVAWIYAKVLLLEYAVAPVQSNPDALVEIVGKGAVSPDVCRALGLRFPEYLSGDAVAKECRSAVASVRCWDLAEFRAALSARLDTARSPAQLANLTADRLDRFRGRV